jgi:hypothetical protein
VQGATLNEQQTWPECLKKEKTSCLCWELNLGYQQAAVYFTDCTALSLRQEEKHNTCYNWSLV